MSGSDQLRFTRTGPYVQHTLESTPRGIGFPADARSSRF
jgi:hypothetical protein